MIKIEEYRNDPCGTSSIPYWKAKKIIVPDSMKIVRNRHLSKTNDPQYDDEPYFRLKHSLESLFEQPLPGGYRVTTATIRDFAKHINSCYDKIGITESELEGYTKRNVYDCELWLAVTEVTSNTIVATGIAELDPECGEGILEWIQVSPNHRRRGLGTYLVTELLRRMKGRAEFATVSGKCDDPSNPESLYRKCGFEGNDIWHILTAR